MQKITTWIVDHKELLVMVGLFIWTEVLGTSDKFKNSSVFSLVKDLLTQAKDKVKTKV